MKQFTGLIVGLVVGIAGALLFQQSLPPEEDSPEEQLEVAELELKKAKKRITTLEADAGGIVSGGSRLTFRDRARSIAEDLREGKEVDLDDVFNAFKPVMNDLSPLFDRMRLVEQRKEFDRRSNEMARKYGLNEDQQKAFRGWLEMKAERDSAAFSQIFEDESSRYSDFAKMMMDAESDEGLDDYMEGVLRGEALENFKTNRLAEKAERVQNEADRNVTRLDSIVELDESQKDEIFVIMARGSRDFDPAMGIGGVGENAQKLVAGQSRKEAIRDVMRPDQLLELDAHQAAKRTEAQAELQEIGLSLPEDWDLYDDIDFGF